MKKHIDQAQHNEHFHESVSKMFPDHYFDWKITITFYSALHLVKALAAKRSIAAGNSHAELEGSINPRRRGAMPITQNAWYCYREMRNYSHASRYTGITDYATFEALKKADHDHCRAHFEFFKNYLKGQGLAL